MWFSDVKTKIIANKRETIIKKSISKLATDLGQDWVEGY